MINREFPYTFLFLTYRKNFVGTQKRVQISHACTFAQSDQKLQWSHYESYYTHKWNGYTFRVGNSARLFCLPSERDPSLKGMTVLSTLYLIGSHINFIVL